MEMHNNPSPVSAYVKVPALLRAFEHTTEHRVDHAEGYALHVTITPARDQQTPLAVLYVLDPEPELLTYAVVMVLIQSLEAYHEAFWSRIAVVGVGHMPSSYGAGPAGWNVAALKELRRADFKRSSPFLAALCDTVVPYSESQLGISALPSQRALVGASLSSLVLLRSLFLHPGLFGRYVFGSPSLPLAPELFELESSSKYAKAAHGTRCVFVAGQHEGGIVKDAERMACTLAATLQQSEEGRGRQRSKAAQGGKGACRAEVGPEGGAPSHAQIVPQEDHTTVKPLIIAHGLQWLHSLAHIDSLHKPPPMAAASSAAEQSRAAMPPAPPCLLRAALPCALQAIEQHELMLGSGSTIQVSLARPLGGKRPRGVIYVLDPQPELFLLLAAALFSRGGYENTSSFRGVALVGLQDLCSTEGVQNLCELGQLDAVVAAEFEEAVTLTEQFLQADGLPSTQRAVVGSSLSSVVLQLSFLLPGLFCRVIIGSPRPSRSYVPEKTKRLAEQLACVAMLVVVEAKGPPKGDPDVVRMTQALKTRGLGAVHVVQSGGGHLAVSSLVSYTMTWLDGMGGTAKCPFGKPRML